ncbi:hypothetical protein [Treponema sp.]|jgi:hypothetical protein|uniref:hypothetical protein n=1 Tax=Treponema sp. TaxID=166 RepID=UPI00388FEF78
MDFATIVSAVSAVGFPIVFCLILYKTMLDQNRQHKEESDKLTEAIHNNTLVIQKLVDKLETDGKDTK